MRGFQCFVKCYVGDKLIKSTSTACWSMVAHHSYFRATESVLGREIYVSKTKEPETNEYRELLISLINEITPCSEVKIDGIEYIKIKTLKTYDQSLIVLNFLRNLWYQPLPGYTKKFFEALTKSHENYSDSLAKLTWANKEACTSSMYSIGHSNVHMKDKLVIRTTEELLKYNGVNTAGFLADGGSGPPPIEYKPIKPYKRLVF